METLVASPWIATLADLFDGFHFEFFRETLPEYDISSWVPAWSIGVARKGWTIHTARVRNREVPGERYLGQAYVTTTAVMDEAPERIAGFLEQGICHGENVALGWQILFSKILVRWYSR